MSQGGIARRTADDRRAMRGEQGIQVAHRRVGLKHDDGVPRRHNAGNIRIVGNEVARPRIKRKGRQR